MKNTKKGFTLIELLIVIAIIGILASIVLVSLSSARDKAKIAAYKAQVHSIQSALIMQCDGAAIVAGNMTNPAGGYVGTNGAVTQSCGSSANGTFSVSIPSVNTNPLCGSTVTETCVTFTNC